MSKKIIYCLILSVLLVLFSAPSIFAAESGETTIIMQVDNPYILVNGEVREADPINKISPMIIGERTLIPLRTVIEAVDGKVNWKEDEQKITITVNNSVLELWVDKNVGTLNNESFTMDVSPRIINNTTMIPIRFISEKCGLNLNWEPTNQSISLSTKNDYIATFSGNKISLPNFNIMLGRALNEINSYILQNNLMPPAGGTHLDIVIQGKKVSVLAKEIALNYCSEREMYLINAKKSDISLTDDDLKNIDSQLTSIVSNQGGVDAIKETLLQKYNVSFEEYSEYFKESYLINKYIAYLKGYIRVSDKDIEAFYQENKDTIDQVTVRHILISTIDDKGFGFSAEKDAAAKKKAEEILIKVKAGEDFGSLVKTYSDDPGSKDNNGEYSFTKGQMVKEFEDWSFSAKEGDTGIIKSTYGYHIMKFVKKTGLNEAKPEIQKYLSDEILNQAIEKLSKSPWFFVIKNQKLFDDYKIDMN